MKILAIDSSSSVRSVAICEGEKPTAGDDDGILAFAESASNRGGRLASLVDEVLSESRIEREDVSAVAVGVGPGSAAGIRSTLAFARGWEVARGIRLIGISSHWAVASEAKAAGIEGRVGVAIRGPMRRFYGSVFRISSAGLEEVNPIDLIDGGPLVDGSGSYRILVGPEVETLGGGQEASGSRLETVFPTARGIGRLAMLGVAEAVCPLEPFSLVTPQFVKAPLPREIPGIS